MSGEQSGLASRSSKALHFHIRDVGRRLTAHILSSQFVSQEADYGSKFIDVEAEYLGLWRVVKGSGMGLTLSGAVSDYTFFDLCEKWATDPAIMAEYCIRFFGRFKDDGIVIIGGTHSSRVSFFQKFKAKAAYFKLKFEVTKDDFIMLDVRAFRGPQWHASGILDTELYIKPTAQKVPLGPDSFHNLAVHTWPQARVHHCAGICNTRLTLRDSVRRFRQWLHTACPDHPFFSRRRPRREMIKAPFLGTWLSIPFSDTWVTAGFGGVLKAVHARWAHRLSVIAAVNGFDTPEALEPHVGWSLHGPHLFKALRNNDPHFENV